MNQWMQRKINQRDGWGGGKSRMDQVMKDHTWPSISTRVATVK